MMDISPSARQPVWKAWPLEHLILEHSLSLGFALHPNTSCAYSSHLNSYLTFCQLHHFPIDPTPDTLSVMTVTFCNPHQRIPEFSASFPSPHAQSRNLTLIPDSEHLFPITLDHSRPDHLYLSLISSSSLSLASSHTLPLPFSRSLRLTLLVLCLCQPYTT